MVARRRSKKNQIIEESVESGLSPETKQGIMVILFFALGGILFLSLFNLAGTAGQWVDNLAAQLFGWDRFLLPFVAILLGASFTFERVRLSTFNYIGLLFFFLSLNATIILASFGQNQEIVKDELATTGGMVGLFLYKVLLSLIGVWGTWIVLLALLLISVMLLFNTSLRSLLTVHTHLTGRIGELAHLRRRDEETWSSEEDETTEEDNNQEDSNLEGEDEVEEESDESSENHFRKTTIINQAPEEQVLSSKRHRKIEIPVNLLEIHNSKASGGDIQRSKEVIKQTFSQFGIDVEMGDVAIGPTVTQFTLRPSEGVKLARIVGLQNDLALALAAHPIRIEAPIPGKSLVGIEVPNQSVALVALRDLLESKKFKSRESNMEIALGKDVSGNAWIVRLDKMPHLLVAGATGSGKSVCLHTIILSLLYQNGPDDLKFIFVDPKRVELTAYTGIPHLLVPPITKVEETVNALKWAVREMERRLDVLSKFGARDLAGYNAKTESKIPKLVIIIDELADLMSTSRNEVEGLIVRIAQMARAVGIHLVLATQRPSVDVITGLIKANIPARIAFAVASQIDSRTILDGSGAEKLLGRGDMLFTSAELGKPKRLQGPFVSDHEIERVTKFLKQMGEPDYNYVITEKQKTGTVLDTMGAGHEDADPLLEEAIQVVIESGKASTSLLQRRLKLGYARAARIIDLLEQSSIVGPADGARPRDVLVKEWPPAYLEQEEAEFDEIDEDESVEPQDENEEIDEIVEEIIEEDVVIDENDEEEPIDDNEKESENDTEEEEGVDSSWFVDDTKK